MKIAYLFFLLLLPLLSLGQDYKNLVLTAKQGMDKKAAFHVEPIADDPALVSDFLRNALFAEGFTPVTEKGAARYVVRVNYAWRKDTGCGGRVVKMLDGIILDTANGSAMVATFSFKQGAFEGKCALDIMNALAKKLALATL